MARLLNGSSDFLSGGDLTFLDIDTYSFSIWVKLDTDASDQIIFEKCDSDFNDGITVFFDDVGPNASNVFEMYHTNPNRIASSTGNQSTTGSWQNIIGRVKWDGGTNSTELFVSGTSVGKSLFETRVADANSFLIGKHIGGTRWLDGSIAYLTFWDSILTDAEVAALAGGKSPEVVHPDGIIRHWDIAGDTSPEPEAIDGTDTLAVTGTTQVTSPTITLPLLTSPIEEDIEDTTASISVVSNQKNGTLHCYVSTSATAPSVTDLKAGTGAAFKTTTPIAPSGFPFVSEVIADADNGDTGIGAPQSVATDGTWFFVSYSDRIYTYNSSWVYQSHIDTSAINSGAHTQVNGMFASGGKLYVTANDFVPSPSTFLGWIYVFSINAGTGAVTDDSNYNSLSNGGHAEMAVLKDNEWWVCNHTEHEIDVYNSSFVYQSTKVLPAATDPGSSRWQGLWWFGDYLVVNLHNENSNSPRVDVYEYNGSSFVEHQDSLLPPTTLSGQGFTVSGSDIYWMERESLTLGNIEKSSIQYNPVAAKNEFAISGLTAGTSYYTYFLQDVGVEGANSIDSTIVESGVWNTTGAATYNQSIAGSMTPAGALATVVSFTSAVDGSITPAGALAKLTKKSFSAVITGTGALIKKTSKLLSGNLTITGAITKRISRLLTANITPTGALTPAVVFLNAISGAITMTGTVAGVIVIIVAVASNILKNVLRDVLRAVIRKP